MKILAATDIQVYETRASSTKLVELRTKSQASPETAKQDIFLSHSLKDAKLIPGVLLFLDSFGASVYVDVLDNSFPATASPSTAEKVKRHISSCRRLVVLVSEENTPTSKWIPWEMGVADGLKSYAHVALLPVGKNEALTAWIPNQEYFGIYPRIIRGPISSGDFPAIQGAALPRLSRQKEYYSFLSSAEWLVMDPASKSLFTVRDWLLDPLR